MTTLTDRYVWAVLRAVPGRQRAELEPEIRALVADAADAHAGTSTREAAERAALVELGDPDALAARYADRTLYLIGPRLYPEWERLLRLLLPIIVPIVGVVAATGSWMAGNPAGTVITSGLGVAFNVGVQTAFWFTLVFAVAERVGSDALPATDGPWTPDDLPDVPAPDRLGLGEAIASVAFGAIVLVVIVWVQLASPIVIEGTAYPLFDPQTWSWLVWYMAGLTALEILFSVGLYLRGRWTWAFAAVNAALGLAFVIPVLWLTNDGRLFNPELVSAVETLSNGNWLKTTLGITAVVILIIVAIDIVDGFRKAWRTSRDGGPMA